MPMLVSPLQPFPIAANDASVTREQYLILIDFSWLHPWVRLAMPSSVRFLLHHTMILVSPFQPSPIAANDASVSRQHPQILIDCSWLHPWVRHDIPASVIISLQLISMLVSPLQPTPIAANDASVSRQHWPMLIDCSWLHPWVRYDIPASVIILL